MECHKDTIGEPGAGDMLVAHVTGLLLGAMLIFALAGAILIGVKVLR